MQKDIRKREETEEKMREDRQGYLVVSRPFLAKMKDHSFTHLSSVYIKLAGNIYKGIQIKKSSQ